jgi:hypothetical protein
LKEIFRKNDGKYERILKLKSPIKGLIFNGQWSFSSSKWTSDIREELNVYSMKSEDGVFWMSFEEFKENFSYIGALKFHDHYKYKWVNIEHNFMQAQQ